MKALVPWSVAVLCWVVASPRAMAVEVNSSSLDQTIEVQPVAKFINTGDNDPRTALMGRKQCVDLLKNDTTPITFSFTFSTQVLRGSCGVAAYCIDKLKFFALPNTGAPTDFQCDWDNGQNSCVDVSSIDGATITDSDTGNGFDVTMPFNVLVDDALTDIVDSNKVRTITNADDCRKAGEAALDQYYFVRAFIKIQTTAGTFNQELSDAELQIDTKRPPSPVQLTDVTVTEGHIYASWQQDTTTDVNDYVMLWSTQDFSQMSTNDVVDASTVQRGVITLDNKTPDTDIYSGKASLTGVDTSKPDVRLFVAVTSRDKAQNLSDPTFPGQDIDPGSDGFEIVPVIDFWENYRMAGGAEDGSCSAVPGSTPAGALGLMFALLGLAAAGWRYRRHLARRGPLMAATLVFVAGAAVGSTAHAESSSWGFVALRLGGYYPAIDSEAGLSGQPFQEIYGDSNRVLVQYEQGVHLYDGFGALGISAAVGYTSFGGHVLLPSNTPANTKAEDESTDFTVFPLALAVYYHFDVLAKRWGIPIVPTGEVGVDWVLWTISGANGDTASYQGVDGNGGTTGWHVTAGINLLLDWIDPQSAAALDRTWGINNTYAFAQYQHLQADDFGSSTSFVLNDDLWMFGLAFDY